MNRSPLRLHFGALAATALALLLGACTTVASSQTGAPQDDNVVDPPARVGRLSAMQGEVQITSEPQGTWEPARLNWPLTTQSMLFVPPAGRAETRIGSTAVRLDGNTQAAFAQLDDHAIAIDVVQGTVRSRLRTLYSGDRFSLAADGVRAEALQPGDYRASFQPERRAFTVAVLAGRLRVVTPSNTIELTPGQEATIERGGATLQLAQAAGDTPFDQWAEARDQAQERLAASRYVSPEVTGVESLDEHGHWMVDNVYGNVWFPTVVAPGWAPYRYGRWVYLRPWGYTWVDDSPWGYAPFHYGRWSQFGGRWGWVPGPMAARPVWSPALVGFVGGGGGYASVNISIGGGSPVGWFPLAPTEIYRPWYRYSPRYVQQYNVVNVTNVRNVNVIAPPQRPGFPVTGDRRARIPENQPGRPDAPAYRYAQRPEALTVVGDEVMRGRRPVGAERVQLTPAQAAQLRPIAVAPGALPAPPAQSNGAAPGLGPQRPWLPPAAVVPRPQEQQPRPPTLAVPQQPSIEPQQQPRPLPNYGRPGRFEDERQRPQRPAPSTAPAEPGRGAEATLRQPPQWSNRPGREDRQPPQQQVIPQSPSQAMPQPGRPPVQAEQRAPAQMPMPAARPPQGEVPRPAPPADGERRAKAHDNERDKERARDRDGSTRRAER
ncbi:DUF6600 domain-containing protein [Rivibacter subsaxonicus]|uniref:FecR family protein n=1 Tax=Rivibacter subsaxonicus TaxID=457575 RepID=A0A4Q7VMY3_9BURK|nr:DUF6600 domain-containing protein [Rivibacter subsaxonicus]RZT97662.1 FecR family protein [Rivibacter subsaxonicus]